MIAILDYDMGNVGSIKNMYHHIGLDDVEITREIEIIRDASHLILPGVGSFDAGMTNLAKFNLIDVINEFVYKQNKPLLGICLGMQLLGRRSDEGNMPGLGLIDFDTVSFDKNLIGDDNIKIPHMGWDYVEIIQGRSQVVKGLEDEEQRYYFVHSYHAVCDSEDSILMKCDYGYKFAASVVKNNVIGFQFHPEKSHKFGMKLLKNFAEM